MLTIDKRKQRTARDSRLTKPKSKYAAERESKENWSAHKHLQSEADMHKTFAEESDEWLERYKAAADYLELRDDGLTVDYNDREKQASGLNVDRWFRRKQTQPVAA
jgi:hypothetical protein